MIISLQVWEIKYFFQPKRKKYNPSTLQLSAKTERYKSNKFTKNTGDEQKVADEKTYLYYIRPFIPFWRVQQLNFETVNAIDEIPKVNENTCPRYVLHDLARTWIEDKSWFDRQDVYNLLKDDLILRIQSKLPTNTLRKLYYYTCLALSFLCNITFILTLILTTYKNYVRTTLRQCALFIFLLGFKSFFQQKTLRTCQSLKLEGS